MSIESANYIKDLNASNPTMADPVHEGPQHYAMIKRVLKTVFPGANGAGFAKAITATEDELNRVSGLTVSIKDALAALVAATKPATAGLNTIYPVGSIYISTNVVNPATTMGFGTWERFGNGRTLVSIADGDAQFGAPTSSSPTAPQSAYKQGGSKASALPSHTHSASLTVSGTAANGGAHTHTTDAQGIHNHGANTAAMNSGDPHKHGQQLPYASKFLKGGSEKAVVPPHLVQFDSTDMFESRDANINHTHGILQDGNHTHSIASSGAHTHTVSGTASGTTASAGVNAATDNLPPYIAVYMWRRTA